MRTIRFVLVPLFLLLPILSGCVPVVATGAVSGALMVEDRRTTGAYVEDEGIEIKAVTRIDEKFKDAVHVNVASFNRNVLLTGEATTEAIKQEAEKMVKALPNVRAVVNDMRVAGTSSFAARSSDTYLTSKVKLRFVDANKFQANHVKVITEAGVVYLVGLVTRKEAEDAVELARTTSGVQKVVKVFEYLD